MRITIATTFFVLTCLGSAYSQVAVIAHPSVPIDQIERTELEDFYTGDIRKWSNGEPVIVFDLKLKSDVKKTFYSFLGKSTSRMKSIWMKNMLSGEGNPPEALKTEEDLLEKVAATPGSIGFISETKANGSVKVLIVIIENDQ